MTIDNTSGLLGEPLPLSQPNGAAPLPSKEDPRIGTVVADRWRIEGLLGSGGMGRVYRARHQNGHGVAIKFLHAAQAHDLEIVRRFRREGYVANRVEHPAVVKVLDDGEDGACPFLVMELLEGQSCRQRLRERGPFSVDEALRITEVAGRALAEAHRVGIVHRDVKPDNLFLDSKGGVRLLDFGLAAIRSAPTNEITVDGVTMGTVGYMSPEQARGDNQCVDARSDVWSLAATCFSLVTGRTIHGGKTPAEQLAFAITKPAPRVGSMHRALSTNVGRVLDRALAFEPKNRYADASAFVDAITSARRTRGSRWSIAVGALGLVAVGLAAIPRRSEPSPRVEETIASPVAVPTADPSPSTAPQPTPSAAPPQESAPHRPRKRHPTEDAAAPVPTADVRPAEPPTTPPRDPLMPRF